MLTSLPAPLVFQEYILANINCLKNQKHQEKNQNKIQNNQKINKEINIKIKTDNQITCGIRADFFK